MLTRRISTLYPRLTPDLVFFTLSPRISFWGYCPKQLNALISQQSPKPPVKHQSSRKIIKISPMPGYKQIHVLLGSKVNPCYHLAIWRNTGVEASVHLPCPSFPAFSSLLHVLRPDLIKQHRLRRVAQHPCTDPQCGLATFEVGTWSWTKAMVSLHFSGDLSRSKS